MSDTTAADVRACLWCGYDIYYSTAYDEPHWVHVAGLATLECPGYGIGEGPEPAA